MCNHWKEMVENKVSVLFENNRGDVEPRVREALIANCHHIISKSTTPHAAQNVDAYLAGKATLLGLPCIRTFHGLMESIYTQVQTGENPDMANAGKLRQGNTPEDIQRMLIQFEADDPELEVTNPQLAGLSVILFHRITKRPFTPEEVARAYELFKLEGKIEPIVKAFVVQRFPAVITTHNEEIAEFIGQLAMTLHPMVLVDNDKLFEQVVKNYTGQLVQRLVPNQQQTAFAHQVQNLPFGTFNQIAQLMHCGLQQVQEAVTRQRGEDEVRIQSNTQAESIFVDKHFGPDPDQERVTKVWKGEEEFYRFRQDEVEYIVARDYGLDLHGTPLQGEWTLRAVKSGAYIDHDTFRSSLFERNNIDYKG